MHYLKKLLESGVLSDVSFSVGEEQEIFKAHKCILAVRSPVFLAMFDGNFKESSTTEEEEETRIQLPDSTPAAFKEFLDYIYHDEEIPLNEENWAPILYLADKYDLPELKKRSVKFVKKACNEDNVFGFYSEARRHFVLSHVNFIKYMIGRTCSLYEDSFLLIQNNEILSEIISMDELDCDEINVFRAAISWASSKIPGEEKDGPELRKVLGPALFAIRFPVIRGSDFEEDVIPSGILYKQEIMNIFCKRNNLDEQISIEFPSHSRNHFNVTCIGSFINNIDSKHCSIKFQVDKKIKIHKYAMNCSLAKGKIQLKSGNEILNKKIKIHKYALDKCSPEGKIQLKSGNEILREEFCPYDGYDDYSLDSPLIIEPHTPYTASIEFNSDSKVAKYKLNQAEEVNGVKWTFSDTNPEEGSIASFRFSCLE